MSSAPATVLTLLDVHDLLEELFWAHQTALLDRDLPAAGAWLRQFSDLLIQHIDDEDTHILPLYASRVPPPEGGKLEFFQLEHQKLKRVLEELHAHLLLLEPEGQALQFGDVLAPPDPGVVSPRKVIELLDRETSFKDLLRHHDARERTFLYPLLAETMSSDEQTLVLKAVRIGPLTAG